MARIIAWGYGEDDCTVRYHLLHWCEADVSDSPGKVLWANGYYVQCHGDCEVPQLCDSCSESCYWWESTGIVDISSMTWVGKARQVNFLGDEVGLQEFLCADLG